MRQTDRSSYNQGIPSPLETQVSYRLGVPLVYVKGELDHDSVEKLRPVVEEELAEQPTVFLLDLSDLTYMDSGGLSLMFDLVRRFESPRWIGAVGTRPAVARLLEMTGLADVPTFAMLSDLEEAAEELAKRAE